MPRKLKVGQYRHRPAAERVAGPEGTVDRPLMRRRFPFRGLIFLLYALGGPLLCAGVSLLLRNVAGGSLVPQRLAEIPLPPAPTVGNVIFGAGLHETAVACGLTGYWLWCRLWKTRPSPGSRSALGDLLTTALALGPLMAFAALPLGVIGLYIRTAPASQPWAVRPFFGLLAAPVVTFSALFTGVVPLVVLGLGLLLGLLTSLLVLVLWREFPEERVES